MKKTVITIFVLAVLLVGSGQVFGCSLCDRLTKLGYSNQEIVSIISGSATRAEAEDRMRQVILRGGNVPVKMARYSPNRSVLVPSQKAKIPDLFPEQKQKYKYSEEEQEVPPMNGSAMAETKKRR
ncbi:MAG TPA: hypothetical protein P5089_02595 [Candidatus Portnoybacteria bacterium]|nr:hypothetical protein [Candidatus Portnoybacteria bacterium]